MDMLSSVCVCVFTCMHLCVQACLSTTPPPPQKKTKTTSKKKKKQTLFVNHRNHDFYNNNAIMEVMGRGGGNSKPGKVSEMGSKVIEKNNAASYKFCAGQMS